MKWSVNFGSVAMYILMALLFVVPTVYADEMSSTNYKANEAAFGIGGELDPSSANYKARMAAGELTVGNSASTNYQFQGGFNTTDVPLLEIAVNGGTYDLGNLDYGSTHTVTPTFTVRSYLSSGYVVIINGQSPVLSDNTHTLTAMSTLASSQPGVEQFGLNIVDNSNPNVGSDPVQVPDASFSFGTAVAGYDTTNMFKFVDGQTVAMSPKSSGQTNYTLTIIANVAQFTPSGQYGGHLNIQVIPTF